MNLVRHRTAPFTATGAGRRGSRRRAQRGMGFGGALIIAVLVVFFVKAGIAVVPAYTTFLQVRSIMDKMNERPDILKGGVRAIQSSLGSQLGINNIKAVSVRDFKFARDPDGLLLSVDYEVRNPLVANIDVVVSFDHEVVLNKP